VRFFEPRTARAIDAQSDSLRLPDGLFLLIEELVVFDHVRHTVRVCARAAIPGIERRGASLAASLSGAEGREGWEGALEEAWEAAARRIDTLHAALSAPLPPAAATTTFASTPLSPPSTPARGGGGHGAAGGANANAQAAAPAAAASPAPRGPPALASLPPISPSVTAALSPAAGARPVSSFTGGASAADAAWEPLSNLGREG
jgi:hypothetical protein